MSRARPRHVEENPVPLLHTPLIARDAQGAVLEHSQAPGRVQWHEWSWSGQPKLLNPEAGANQQHLLKAAKILMVCYTTTENWAKILIKCGVRIFPLVYC